MTKLSQLNARMSRINESLKPKKPATQKISEAKVVNTETNEVVFEGNNQECESYVSEQENKDNLKVESDPETVAESGKVKGKVITESSVGNANGFSDDNPLFSHAVTLTSTDKNTIIAYDKSAESSSAFCVMNDDKYGEDDAGWAGTLVEAFKLAKECGAKFNINGMKEFAATVGA